jgi:CsoR family transcriptional regulator, copper-sensing transcriptional repressor
MDGMSKDIKQLAGKRLAIIRGHLDKVIKMVEEDVYCPDVIHQSQAVQSALKKVDELILHGHLHSCVLHDIHGSESEKEKLIQEIVEVFRKEPK